MQVEKLKSDKRYKDIFQITKEEFNAQEELAVSDGEIYEPLFVWKGQGILVYGYHCWDILKAHPAIRYTMREIEFQDWQEAQVWAVEHYIAKPEIRLWQKLEAAIDCESYWLLKEEAKKAQGSRNDLSSVSEDKLDCTEVNEIIAKKVGCSATYVYNFKKILSSGRKDIIALCRKGELSISAAYLRLFLPKKPKGGDKPGPQTPLELDIDGSDIFDDCEKNINIGKKNTTRHNGIPVDPVPIAQQIKTAKVPDGAIWVTIHKKDGQMQVVRKNFDESIGVVHTTVNSYNCKLVSTDNDIIIIQADHINGGTREVRQKDDSEFEEASKKAS